MIIHDRLNPHCAESIVYHARIKTRVGRISETRYRCEHKEGETPQEGSSASPKL